ncbi:hypothetical protein AB0F43_14485 [Kribbella sp. NPDC023972]|uniref:hypothetical protein n=1 Tax=Kribbella sp. NPDC023972 TaxID=3154795 RepID=UPI0033D34EC0
MSNESDYDRRVKDILDRVAKGHLSTEEGATLIAAIRPAPSAASGGGTTPEPGAADGPVAQEPVADAGSKGKTGWPSADDLPSPSVWADVVDSPDPADAPAGKHAAGPSPVTEPATESDLGPEPASAPESAPGAEPAAAAEPASVAEPAAAAEPEPVAAQNGAQENDAQDSVVDEAPTETEDVEEEHSNVPMPAGVQRVTVRAIGRRVRLIGEPAINGVAVDGPHVIKRDGDTLAISSEGDMGVSIDGFSMLRNPTNLKSHVNGLARELSIRVNPSLQVEVEVTGGSVNAERLPGLTRVRVTAGTAKVSDVAGPIDLLVQAGSASLDAQITKGRSRVRVESGAATVNLRRGSDVRVHTESQLGRVSWAGAVTGQSKDVEIGRGRAALDVEVLVGTAQIVSD